MKDPVMSLGEAVKLADLRQLWALASRRILRRV